MRSDELTISPPRPDVGSAREQRPYGKRVRSQHDAWAPRPAADHEGVRGALLIVTRRVVKAALTEATSPMRELDGFALRGPEAGRHGEHAERVGR